MNYIIKVFLLALFAGALMLLGAQTGLAETKVYGDVSASMGLASYDGGSAGPGTSEYISGHEANLWWSGGDGPLTGRVRIRLRGADERSCCGSSISGGDTARTVSALRGVMKWKAGKGLDVYFHGRSLGIPGQKNNAKVLNVRNEFNNDDVDDDVSVLNVPGLGVTFKASGFLVGAHIMAACKPACLNKADNESIGGGPDHDPNLDQNREDSTLVLHVSGKAGPAKFHVQSTTSSAVNDDAANPGSDVDVEGSSLWAGVGVKFGDITVGLEFASIDFNGDADSSTSTDVIDHSLLAVAVKFKFGLGISYFTREVTTGSTVTEEFTSIDATYKIKVSKLGHLSIEYRQFTENDPSDTTTDERTHSIILFGAKTKF